MPRGTQGRRRSPVPFAYRGLTCSARPFQCRSARNEISYSVRVPQPPLRRLSTPAWQRLQPISTSRVWAPPFSLATTQGMLSSPGGTEMFQFPPFPPSRLCVQRAVPGYCPGGFPHSGIPGSAPDDGSPRLIAAIHALRRLLTPRHPPYALSSLIHARRLCLIRLEPYCASRRHMIRFFRSIVNVRSAVPHRRGLPGNRHKAQKSPAHRRVPGTVTLRFARKRYSIAVSCTRTTVSFLVRIDCRRQQARTAVPPRLRRAGPGGPGTPLVAGRRQ